MRRAIFAPLVLGSLLAGCAMPPARPDAPAGTVVIEPIEPWRADADADDAARIDTLVATWGHMRDRLTAKTRKAVADEGPLLDAGAALDHFELPPGSYSCRLVRLEGSARGTQVSSFPANFCYVQSSPDKVLSLTKQTGSELPAGRLYPSGDRRYIFLGARQRAVGDNTLAYGDDMTRNVIGVVERVGAFRWRLVAPVRDGRSLDIYELTPVPTERQPG